MIKNTTNLDSLIGGSKAPIRDLSMNKILMLNKLRGVVDQLVSGDAPITLANAANRAIKSLKQTGSCKQESIPAPSAPVPIKCNNGVLTIVDDELPSAYKRVIGFSCNNNAVWQITDFKLRGSDTLRFSVSITARCNIIGVYTGAASGG